MSTTIFTLDLKKKALSKLTKRSMAELHLLEATDLESWLASTGDGLLGRKILWLSRQDKVTDDQRSDLIGIDEFGDLLVTELKRGQVDEGALTQALAYAAEYANKASDDLAKIYADHSVKHQAENGLTLKVKSIEDAQVALNKHVGEKTEVNESQTLILIGEDFTAKALAICDYLNSKAGEASYSMECWRYSIFQKDQEHYFTLEQILPPPSVRDAIDEKREAARNKKYARDPVRIDFMRRLLFHLNQGKVISGSRNRGQSYDCQIQSTKWAGKDGVAFSVVDQHPQLTFGSDLIFKGDAKALGVTITSANGQNTLTFGDMDMSAASFTTDFGDRFVKTVEAIELIQAPQTPGDVGKGAA